MKTTKTFNVAEDKFVNEVALGFARGNEEAGEQFGEIMKKKAETFVRNKFTGDLTKEDAVQELLMLSVELAFKYAERYEGENFLQIFYTSARNKMIDITKGAKAQKRARVIEVGDEMFNREVSLQVPTGDDGQFTFESFVAADQKSVEDQVLNGLNKTGVEQVVSEFVASTKGRNGKIIALVYAAHVDEWANDELNDEIAYVLEAEKGTAPNKEAVRQAKSRAIKALRNAMIDGKLTSANQVEWDF